MLPVLSREVVEGKQRVAILDQALDSLVVFDAPGFDEGIERGECILCKILDLRFHALPDEIIACHSSLGGEFGEWIDVVQEARLPRARPTGAVASLTPPT